MLKLGKAAAQAPSPSPTSRPALRLQASGPRRSFTWLAKMMTAMPRRKADRHRIGDVFDEGAEAAASPTASRMMPDISTASSRPSMPCTATGRRHQHDEGTGRPADLEAAAAQHRDDEATDDGGVEAAIRRDARRRPQSPSTAARRRWRPSGRQSTSARRSASAITLAQNRHQLRGEQSRRSWARELVFGAGFH